MLQSLIDADACTCLILTSLVVGSDQVHRKQPASYSGLAYIRLDDLYNGLQELCKSNFGSSFISRNVPLKAILELIFKKIHT